MHRTNRYLNNHVEQDHRCIKQRYRPTGGLKTFATAACFCHLVEEIRALFRPQSCHHQRLSFHQRRCIHRHRFAYLMGVMATA
jgi:putative transposase